MVVIVAGLPGGKVRAFGRWLGLSAFSFLAAACASSDSSYQADAIAASQAGNQKKAIELATKEVARYATSDECSPTKNVNCGTLALAYGSLAEYQILDGNKRAGEASFRGAKRALEWMSASERASAVGIVYRDVSEAFWKVGDRDRAMAVFDEGRKAGGDSWLYSGSAAKEAARLRAATAEPAADAPPPAGTDPQGAPTPLVPVSAPGGAPATPAKPATGATPPASAAPGTSTTTPARSLTPTPLPPLAPSPLPSATR